MRERDKRLLGLFRVGRQLVEIGADLTVRVGTRGLERVAGAAALVDEDRLARRLLLDGADNGLRRRGDYAFTAAAGEREER